MVKIKKTLLLILIIITAFTFVGCTKEKLVTVKFVTNNPFWIINDEDYRSTTQVYEPETPKWLNHELLDWYADAKFNELVTFPYKDLYKVKKSITFYAQWYDKSTAQASTSQGKALADANALVNLDGVTTALPKKGSRYGSDITWESDSVFISDDGLILPIPGFYDIPSAVELKATFNKEGYTYEKYYEFNGFDRAKDVVIDSSSTRNVNFYNLTTEYLVNDNNLNLYYEKNGSVPYVKMQEFLGILEGFIDPKYYDEYNEHKLTYTVDDDGIVIYYEYTDDEIDKYALECTLDASKDTIRVNTTSFFVGYVVDSETNYGRNLTYPDTPYSYEQGKTYIEYDLYDYSIDLVMYQDDLVAPLALVNQLFLGQGYYNIYYNYDNLYGLYALPDKDSSEYSTIKDSTQAGTSTPDDLAIFTFNMLAFSFDYSYGLKDFKGIKTYYDLLLVDIDELCTNDPYRFDNGLFSFLNQKIDEMHTSYGFSSFYNSTAFHSPTLTFESLGETGNYFYSTLYTIDAYIADMYGLLGSAWAYDRRPEYVYLDSSKKTVMLALDSFDTADIEETTSFSTDALINVFGEGKGNLIPTFNTGTKFYNYDNSTKDTKTLDLIIKGASLSYLSTYDMALKVDGFILRKGPTTYSPNRSSYEKKISNITYTITIDYDNDLRVFYIGLIEGSTLNKSIMEVIKSDSGVYMDVMLSYIERVSPNLEHILLDVSMNTGGNIAALYRVVGYITDQPFFVSEVNEGSKFKSTKTVKIENQTAYTQYDWALLVSPVTFSAGNSLTNIFKENDLGQVIGNQTGGGACSILPIMLPNGSAFTFSSNNAEARVTGGRGTVSSPYTYELVQDGIEPDIYIPLEYYYTSELVSLLGWS